jgi:predicted trehalose synthase
MIMNRRTHIVKRGCMAEAVALVKAEIERAGITYRIYTPNIAPLVYHSTGQHLLSAGYSLMILMNFLPNFSFFVV